MKTLYHALLMSVSMFTVIPVPTYDWDEDAGKHMMKFYPLIGLVIGLLWYGSYILLRQVEVSTLLAGAVLLSVPFLLTGFLHLDGFMDVSDALLSRRPREDKLRILKDPVVGAFAVISLALLFIVEFAAIESVLSQEKNMLVLIFIPIISRTLAAFSIITRHPISDSYFGKFFKEGTTLFDRLFLLIILILMVVIGGIIPIIMIGVGVLLLFNCEKELGGVNGDVAGYLLVITEFVGLLVFAIL